MQHSIKNGFTLIELSIVLVIIGLITGAILVGRDLINAAAIRSTVSQIEKYNSSVNTFRNKYGYLPGDIPADQANAYGFAVRSGLLGEGDGDGLLEDGTSGGATVCGETSVFWNDLSTANLIEGNYIGPANARASCLTTLPATTPTDSIIPPAKLGNSNHIIVFNDDNNSGAVCTLCTNYNYFEIIGAPSGPLSTSFTNFNGIPTPVSLALTPQQAYSIDTKIDDGYPTTGRVISRDNLITGKDAPRLGAVANPAVSGTCGDSSATPTAYNLTFGNTNACAISIQFQ